MKINFGGKISKLNENTIKIFFSIETKKNTKNENFPILKILLYKSSILGGLGPLTSCSYASDHVWTSLDKFGQVWTCLDKFGQV